MEPTRVYAIYFVVKVKDYYLLVWLAKKQYLFCFRGVICDEDFEEGLYLEHKSEV